MKINCFIQKNRWPDCVMLIIFIVAFAVATYNHVNDIVKGGMFPYTKGETPNILNLYWTSLTLLDPLAIFVLVLNIRIGYIVALCIMLTNVPINLYASVNYGLLPFYENYMLLAQFAFLVFLLSTIRRVWRLSNTLNEQTSTR